MFPGAPWAAPWKEAEETGREVRKKAEPCSDAEAGGAAGGGDEGESPLPVAPPWVCPALGASAATVE